MYSYLPYDDVDRTFWGIESAEASSEEVAPNLPMDYREEEERFEACWRNRLGSLGAAPEEAASLISKYFFTWLNPCISLALREELDEDRFPVPRRDHRTRMSGSKLSRDFRSREMLDGRLLWSKNIEKTVRRGPDGTAATPLAGQNDEFPAPANTSRVAVENNLCEVFFKGEPHVRGRLRWIGSLRCCDAPQRLYAGVEWNDEIPSYRATLHRSRAGRCEEGLEEEGIVHRGTFHGEQLFYQTSEGPPRCTLEDVNSLVLLHEMPVRYHSIYKQGKEPRYPRQPNVMWSLLRSFKRDLLAIIPGAVIQLLCFNIASPILIRLYVQYLQKDGISLLAGVALAFAFLVIKGIEPLASNKFEQRTERAAALFRTATLSLLFEKCMTISTDSFTQPEISAGRVLAMASTDIENIKRFPLDVVHLVMAPSILLFCLGNMAFLMGWSALGGVLAVVILIPIQGGLVKWQEKLQKLGSLQTDRRLRQTNELLSGIRVVKMMGWEMNFIHSVYEAREEELSCRKKMQLAEVLVSLANDGTSVAVLMLVITLYYFSGYDLTPEVALPVLAMLGSLMYGLMMFPTAVNTVVKFMVSCRRVSRFLECEDAAKAVRDIREYFPEEDQSDNGRRHSATSQGVSSLMVHFHNAEVKATVASLVVPLLSRPSKIPKFLRKWLSFFLVPQFPVEMQWTRAGETKVIVETQREVNASIHAEDSRDEEEEEEESEDGTHAVHHTVLSSKTLLRRLSLDIHRKGLTVIIGPTGSGKSVFLQSLLDCFTIAENGGSIWASRNVAFVPQQPWIMQDTIRFNVTFFNGVQTDSDEWERSPHLYVTENARLEQAVAACQLTEDLKDMPHGINTEIGERGVNLSGGQKARISLARAVYADRDLYLLDDPLSALDAHVGDRILHEVILGVLRDKTVLLATHQVQCLPYAERVIVMENGEVQFNGSYAEYRETPWGKEGEAISTQDEGHNANEENTVIDLDTVALSPVLATVPSLREEDRSSTEELLALEEGKENVSFAIEDEGRANKKMEKGPTTAGDGATETGSSSWMVEEEKEHGSVPYYIYKQYVIAGGGLKPLLLSISLFVLFNIFYMISSAWLSLWSAHALPVPMSDGLALAIYLLTQGTFLVFAPLSKFCVYRMSLRASRTLHHSLLTRISSGTLGFFDSVPLGRILNRFSKDMYVVDDEITQHLLLFLDIGCYVVSTLAMAVIAMPRLVVVVIVTAVAFFLLLRYYAKIIREIRRRGSIAESPMFSMLESTLNSGRETIDAYGKSHFFFRKALARLDQLYSCMYVERVMDQWLNIRVEYLGGFVMFAVTAIGIFKKCTSKDGRMPSETMALISLSLTMCVDLFWSLPLVVKTAAWMEASMNSIQRVQHYLDHVETESVFVDGEENMTKKEKNKAEVTVMSTEAEESPLSSPLTVSTKVSLGQFPAAAGHQGERAPHEPMMAFNNVYMRYRAGLPCVLRHVSFKIYPNEKIGVVGRTGSGKSTLLLTFMRLVNISEGTIEVCGKNIMDYHLRDLRRQFALIPQDPVLFEGTIRSNMDPFGECTDEEIQKVLEVIGLRKDTAAREEEGGTETRGGEEEEKDAQDIQLDTAVNEGGKNFSVGQRQLLCMGRALLKKGNRFVLMDEATANVDPQLDQRIQEVIHRYFAPFVVVTIAHRLHTVASYDRIIVMHRGQVVEQGRPRELMNSNDSQLYQMVVRGAAGLSTPEESRQVMVDAAIRRFLEKCKFPDI